MDNVAPPHWTLNIQKNSASRHKIGYQTPQPVSSKCNSMLSLIFSKNKNKNGSVDTSEVFICCSPFSEASHSGFSAQNYIFLLEEPSQPFLFLDHDLCELLLMSHYVKNEAWFNFNIWALYPVSPVFETHLMQLINAISALRVVMLRTHPLQTLPGELPRCHRSNSMT